MRYLGLITKISIYLFKDCSTEMHASTESSIAWYCTSKYPNRCLYLLFLLFCHYFCIFSVSNCGWNCTCLHAINKGTKLADTIGTVDVVFQSYWRLTLEIFVLDALYITKMRLQFDRRIASIITIVTIVEYISFVLNKAVTTVLKNLHCVVCYFATAAFDNVISLTWPDILKFIPWNHFSHNPILNFGYF